MRDGEDPHLAVGAYVLHALPPDEHEAFERHLAGCAACRREVSELSEAVARLAESDAAAVPSGLRERVLAEIARTPQQQKPARVPTAARPRSRFRQRALMPALAACAAAAVALGGISVWQYSRAEDAHVRAAAVQESNDALTGVLTAADAAVHTGKLSNGAEVAVITSRSRNESAFVAQNLPPLNGRRVYELWYAAKSGDLSLAGLLPVSGDRAARVLDRPLAGAVAVGITIEPAGGSAQPTTTPLGVIPLSA